MRLTRAGVAAALLLAGCYASAGVAHADPEHPAPPTTIDKDGTYTVGTDIAPGTYISAGPVADGTCYWKRVQGDKIVDNALSKQSQVVQIDAGDTAFKTDGCQPWQQSDCMPGCAPAQMNPVDLLGQIGRLIVPH